MFDQLGRFEGLGDEMRHIVLRSLAAYPACIPWRRQPATAEQLAMVATGEGVHSDLMHTHRIIERYLPRTGRSRCAPRSSSAACRFTAINGIHVPVALGSMLMIAAVSAYAIWRRRVDDFALLTGNGPLAILGNAFVCGVLSGPHDRYGARMVWIATFAVLIT